MRHTGSGSRRDYQEHTTMPKTPKPLAKVQLVCRIDAALNTRVRTEAARAGQTLSTFLERALAKAVARTAQTKAQ
jgi:predicted HicB family RNase H-like nuclease